MTIRKETIVVTCSEFDPLTEEELNLIKVCKEKGHWLIVGLYSDWWLTHTRGGFVQKYDTRAEIVKNIKLVDEVFKFDDSDGTVYNLLEIVRTVYHGSNIVFISDPDTQQMPQKKLKGVKFETVK